MTDDAWISTVRVVRDMGNVQALMPPFVDSFLDLPATLFRAIQVALMVCGWYDQLEEEEMPPKHLWLDAKAVKHWLAQVRENRKSGRGGDAIEDPVRNAAAEGLVVGG